MKQNKISNSCYLYRHIRLDNNVPFYVGIGSDINFKRAFKKNRNKYWNNIVGKTKYEIEIMLTDLTWEEACKKECEFINLYGRMDLNLGTLCNMTNGGEGSLGKIPSNETRKKIGNAGKGRKKTEEQKKAMSDMFKGRKGKIPNNESRKKMSDSQKGLRAREKHHLFGKKHSIETIIKMKKPKSEQHRTNCISAWVIRKEKGVVHTEESKLKRSETMKKFWVLKKQKHI